MAYSKVGRSSTLIPFTAYLTQLLSAMLGIGQVLVNTSFFSMLAYLICRKGLHYVGEVYEVVSINLKEEKAFPQTDLAENVQYIKEHPVWEKRANVQNEVLCIRVI